MKLGLKRDEVKLVPYDIEWKNEFLRVKQEILNHINVDDEMIQHIGSTAIMGMMAKPIIDIVMGVDDIITIDNSIITGLKKVGFMRLGVELSAEVVFAKFTDDTYQEKTHYVHLVEYDKKLWSDLIFFKDYLNSNETEREEYLNLKLDYVQYNSSGIGQYTNHKKGFVKRIYAKRQER
ncbi:GrpB family protein [Paenisporosarcina antarctica]|uniref:GrpB family protein n=1 Tax=Paenisporosarcina antarctica TaxID=417367 RepID=A0A4P7A2Y1_9BACL|nr:GrpB family protein [Paenisporosarcina antarctica]QBP43058.1 GrpB family protein [Paenisporosarcina antarctica]